MQAVRIECFGEPTFVVDGQPVTLGGSQPLTLAVLASAGPRGITKSALYHELFAEAPQSSGEQAGVMRVQRLSKKLEASGLDSVIVAAGPRLGIAPKSEVDIWTFEELIASPAMDDQIQAVHLFDEPFRGVDYAAASVIGMHSERLRSLYVEALARIGMHVGERTPSDVLDRIHNALELDPFNEGLVVGAATAKYRAGNQTVALQIIGDYRTRLLENYGLNPGGLVDETEYRILNHERSLLDPHPAPLEPDSSTVLAKVPPLFVGQKETLERLQLELDDVIGGRTVMGPVHVLRGPAGSGKSTVMAKILAAVETDRVNILVGSASADGGSDESNMLYRPFTEALPSIRPVVTDLQLARNGVTREDVWNAVHVALQKLAASGPTVIVLEDFHDADSQSHALLRFLVGSSRPGRLAIIVTTRDPIPESPWSSALDDLAAGSLISLAYLEPLTFEDVQAIVDADHAKHPAITRRRFALSVFEKSQGNPLVATVLSRDANNDLDPTLLPESLSIEDVYSSHLDDRVEDEELERVLIGAALVGLQFEATMVASALGLSLERTESQLDQASQLHLCEKVEGNDWRFDHLLTVAHFARRAGPLRSVVFSRLIELGTENPLRMLRYVRGSLSHMDPDLAAERLAWAADLLEQQSAFEEAAVAWTALTELLPSEDHRLLKAMIRLAGAKSRVGAFEEARSLRSTAVELARTAKSPELIVGAALAGLPDGESVGGEPDRFEVLRTLSSEERGAISPVELAKWKLRFARLNDDAEAARSIINTIDPTWALSDLHAEHWVGVQLEVLAFRSQIHQSESTYEELVALEAVCPDSAQRAELLHRVSLAALIDQAPKSETLALVERAASEARVHGSPRTRWSVDVLETTLAQIGVRAPTATPDTARTSGHRWGIPDVETNWLLQMSMQLWMTGMFAMVGDAIEAVRNELTMNVAWQAGIALSAAVAGDSGQADREMATVAALLDATPDGVWSPFGAAMLAEASWLRGDAAMAERSIEALTPRSGRALVVGTGSAHFGPVDRYLGLAEATLGRTTAKERLAYAAAQAARSGALRWSERIAENIAALR